MTRTEAPVANLDPRISAYYDRGEEVERLGGGQPTGPLEFARTQGLSTTAYFHLSGESDPALQAAGSHLLAVGKRSG